MAHHDGRDERAELDMLKAVQRSLDRIEDEIEELEDRTPPAPTTYPRTVAIVVA